MTPDTLRSFHEHALAEYPRESCGIVVSMKGEEIYVACRNVAVAPTDQFVIDRDDYVAAEDRGDIIVIAHSHPDVAARPSDADRVQCEASGVPWAIVSVMPGPVIAETLVINPTGYEAPYVARAWAHGVLDCWALCRDWYAREWGITLPNPPRADEWWNDGASDLYSDAALTQVGFTRVRDGSLRAGDLLLMQIRSRNRVPNHAGVYLGDGQMLHHLYGRLSTKDVYGGYFAEVTRSVWRHAQAPSHEASGA